MEQKKTIFRNKLPPRVTHEEYQQIVQTRKRVGRIWAAVLGIPGILSLLAVIASIFSFKLGELTKGVITDIIALSFISLTGIIFCNHARYLWQRFPCRFCLANNPEGSTYCLKCSADLLSNETLPEHKKFFE